MKKGEHLVYLFLIFKYEFIRICVGYKIKLEKIIINFGKPEDGWLIFNIKIDDFALEIDSSDVPNPIQQFCSVIKFSLNDLESEVLFHLEPNFNIFRFSPKNELINFHILFLENNQERLLKEISGDFEEIVFPFFQAIKKFLTLEYDESIGKKLKIIKLKRWLT